MDLLVIVSLAFSSMLMLMLVRLMGRVGRLEGRLNRLAPSPLTSRRSPPTTATAPPPAGLSAEGQELVRVALEDGEKIAAIKYVREETGIGLSEAKRYVDSLERR